LEQGLAREGSAPLLRARALSAAGWLAWTMGDARRHHLLLQAAALFRDLGATAELADALSLAGLSIRGMWSDELRDPSAYEEGGAYLEESLALARQTGEPFAIAMAAAHMASTVDLRRDGDRRRARVLAEEALAVFTARQSNWGIGMAEQVIGAVAAYEGDYARAAAGFATHLDVRRAAGAVPGVAYGLLLQGELALAMGDAAQATAYLEESLATYQTMNIDRRRMARVARLLGEIALGRGQSGEALRHFAASLRAAQEGGTLASVAGSLEGLAGGAAAAGQAERALRLAGAAHALREATAQPLSEDGEARLELWLAPARALLSPSEQASLWTAGQALTPDRAIAAALRAPHG
jgi:tetratricopeptide (TPR) repeat protein